MGAGRRVREANRSKSSEAAQPRRCVCEMHWALPALEKGTVRRDFFLKPVAGCDFEGRTGPEGTASPAPISLAFA